MTRDEIEETLRLHELWLNGDPMGVSDNLVGSVLKGANLMGARLYDANLAGCRVDVEAIATSETQLSWWLLKMAAIVE